MKKLKFLFKWSIILISIFILLYLGIYTYAKYKGKLSIESANKFYIYDYKDEVVDDLNDTWVSIDYISDYVKIATISIEDKNFYKHSGFDYLRIIKSLYVNIKNRKTLQGASTISQQLSKNLFLTFERTWQRKIKEAWLTIQLESQYDKDEILEAYLNTINYGGIYGIEKASQYYFHKSSKDLDLAEASILVGIPKSPSNYSPITNLENAKNRQLLILNTMVNLGYITEEEKENAYNKELTYYGNFLSDSSKTIMYYKDAVMQELDKIDSIPDSFIETGGLKIYTYLDLNAQSILEKSMDKNIENKDIEIAGIIMEPNTGHVLALTGGRDYAISKYNRAINAKRQMGSTLKPFLYYAALENGFTASTTFTSEKTTFVFAENKTYSPSNFNNTYANKSISMPAALSFSDNIYAVKTHLFLGEDTLVSLLKRIGITTNIDSIPSLALGSEEMKLIDMTAAYSTLANLGYKVNPKLIRRVEDINGNVLYENKEEKEAVLNPSLAYIMNENLTSTYNYNFIDYAYPTCYDLTKSLTHKYSIKTGTTDTDHLVFGYNPNIVVGLWSGFDNNEESDAVNGKNLKYMWRDIVEEYLKDTEDTWYKIPDNVVGVLVDPITGVPATKKTKKPTMFYYLKGTEPTFNDSLDTLIPTIKEKDKKEKR